MSDGWRVDDMVIHRIVEEEGAERPVAFFLPAADPALLAVHRDWFEGEGIEPATGHMRMSFHSFVVQTPSRTVLIDGGIGQGKHLPMAASWNERIDDRWMREFTAAGLRVEDVHAVVCTHMHADHVGWNTSLRDGAWRPTFPNARYLFVDVEYASTERWVREHADNPSVLAQSRRGAWEQSIAPVVRAGQADLVDAAHVLDDHLRLVPTPGHTAGHVSVAAGRDGDQAVFTGDIFYTALQAQRPDLHMSTDADPVQAAETRRAFLTRYAETDTLVCTPHLPAPSAGHLRRWRNAFRLDFVDPGLVDDRPAVASFA